MRNTRKYRCALDAARALFPGPDFQRITRENDTLYDALEKRGYFWEAESSTWTNRPKSSSIFTSDDGLPTGEFRIRVMAHPAELEEVVEAVREGLHQRGVRITEVSNIYPNQHGPGVRIYLTAQIAPSR